MHHGECKNAHVLVVVLAFALGCDSSPDVAEPPAPPPAVHCPAILDAPNPLPGILASHLDPEYWIERSHGDPSETLMPPGLISDHNRDIGRLLGGFGAATPELDAPAGIRARLGPIEDNVRAGRLVDREGQSLPANMLRAGRVADSFHPVDQFRRSEQELALRCTPIPLGLYRPPVDLAFDRNRCSTIRSGELIQVVGMVPGGMLYVRSRNTSGFISAEAELSPIDDADLQSALAGPRDRPAFTQRAFVSYALSFEGRPYGWGGQNQGLDCSRLVHDIVKHFGLHFPRNSGQQAHAGRYTVELSPDLGDAERLEHIVRAAEQGVVLLQLPGHIMIYLGTNDDGQPMVLHALAEYVEPCADGRQTLRRVNRVAVSDLSLGHGSDRGSLLQRITTVTILGP